MKCHWITRWLFLGVLLSTGGCQPNASQEPPIAVCSVVEEGKTFQSLIESANGKLLHLAYLIVDGKVLPPFNEKQRLKIHSAKNIVGSDGCNKLEFSQKLSTGGAKQSPFFQNYYWSTTMAFCSGSSEFALALATVSHFKKCSNEYWLYYDKTIMTPEGIMVFTVPSER